STGPSVWRTARRCCGFRSIAARSRTASAPRETVLILRPKRAWAWSGQDGIRRRHAVARRGVHGPLLERVGEADQPAFAEARTAEGRVDRRERRGGGGRGGGGGLGPSRRAPPPPGAPPRAGAFAPKLAGKRSASNFRPTQLLGPSAALALSQSWMNGVQSTSPFCPVGTWPVKRISRPQVRVSRRSNARSAW